MTLATANLRAMTIQSSPVTLMNGSIAVVAKTIKNAAASAAKAEAGALLADAQLAAPMRAASEESGHLQPPTPMKTDSATASGIIDGRVKQHRSRAIDMRRCGLGQS